MAYTNFQNCTKQEYDSIIYSQEDVNKCKIYFNNVELQNADNYLEKITFKKRVLPENGKKVFGLDNFIAEEVEIIIHDIDPSIIQDKVRIELGTLVDEQNDTWEYVPMGVFNIQDTPTRNDDKITIKLRDNAVLFDFNYNAKPLIDNQYEETSDTNYLADKYYYSYSDDEYVLLIVGTDYEVGDAIVGTIYQKKGSATLLQILEDICNKANVTCGVSSFQGDDIDIGIYDNTIKARAYVSYIAEQAGCIAKIDRSGNLIFAQLDSLTVQRIPLSVCSKYIKGTTFEIERLVYELGTIKFETSSDETLQTMYLSSLNPYIGNQQQVDDLFNNILDGFAVDSVEINDNIIGNPAIDGYDLIEVYDDEDEEETTIFTTLANNTLYYNGKFRSKYKTEIGLEERKENTTNVGDTVFKKTVQSEIDLVNGKISTTVSDVQELQLNSVTNSDLNSLSEQVGGQIADLGTDLSSLQTTVQTNWEQTATSAQLTFLQGIVTDNKDEIDSTIATWSSYIRFENGNILLGESGNLYKLKIENDRIQIYYNDVPLSNWIKDTFTAKQVNIGNLDSNGDLTSGFGFIPRDNGSLSFKKIK